jgi:hypothetical protein
LSKKGDLEFFNIFPGPLRKGKEDGKVNKVFDGTATFCFYSRKTFTFGVKAPPIVDSHLYLVLLFDKCRFLSDLS